MHIGNLFGLVYSFRLKTQVCAFPYTVLEWWATNKCNTCNVIMKNAAGAPSDAVF